ncbi:MAG TPA: SdpI family protein [Candidatus Pacearchaeota archaeon]|nr:SdpI family protein [Candidatus Pacearchaeota archaeon]HOU45986.1 SdpI family protein [Candidatus Pacearchaeota archaeon]HPM08733.1 SdpI family protein [Candidatus Pacearchaeota archaeon]HQI74834.1 SdpI family protein [Candidatus Pacearchaeota archaeon]
MNKFYTASLIIIALAIGMGIYLYPVMPDLMPSHWNVAGEIDGYMPKTSALFIMPIISLIMLLLMMWFPKADPKQENIAHNKPFYEKVVFAIVLFFFLINCLTLAVSLGYKIKITSVMVPALGLLFFFIGKQMENIKPNWFFGIRTPWTIHNEEIWEKTNKMGSKLFRAFGILLFCLGFAYPVLSFSILIAFAITLLIWSFVYPYILWKNKQ